MPRPLPPLHDAEFELCVACCRWPQDDAAMAQVRERAQGVDWDRFLTVVRRHRVHGLTHRALRQADIVLPRTVQTALAEQARKIAVQNIMMAADCVALDGAFAAAGIARMFVKGLTLAKLAYDDIGIKANHDLDVLIAPRDLEAALAILESRGFRMIVPTTGRERIATWHRYSKESSWRHVDTGRMIDLHTALTDSPLSLKGVDVTSPAQTVMLAGTRGVPTLTLDDLFAYLAVHGASSGWSRLKWIADFAALFGALDEEALRGMQAHATAIGAGRGSALAILLADRLFDWSVGDALRRDLAQDRKVQTMVQLSLTALQGGETVRHVTETRFGTIPIHRINLALRPEWRHKAYVLRGRLGTRLF